VANKKSFFRFIFLNFGFEGKTIKFYSKILIKNLYEKKYNSKTSAVYYFSALSKNFIGFKPKNSVFNCGYGKFL